MLLFVLQLFPSLPPIMAALQRQVQSSLDGDCFDMWHDYMNLATLLQKLCAEEKEKTDTESPKGDPEEEPWSGTQTSPLEENSPARTGSGSSLSSAGSADFCRFCKQNGESVRVYRSHKLRADDGKVTCPVLRSYTCPTCGSSGDHAHTRRYCPRAQRKATEGRAKLRKFW